MNQKISLDFGNPFEKRALPEDTFTPQKKVFQDKIHNSFNFTKQGLPKHSIPGVHKKVTVEPKFNTQRRILEQKNLPLFEDKDKDGLPNILDSYPRNPNKPNRKQFKGGWL
jgi:hypothetical protein